MRHKAFSMVAVVIFMIAALSSHVSGGKGETVTITENLLLGEWKGNTLAIQEGKLTKTGN